MKTVTTVMSKPLIVYMCMHSLTFTAHHKLNLNLFSGGQNASSAKKWKFYPLRTLVTEPNTDSKVKLLVIVIIVFKRYPSTYCLLQGSSFICSNFWKLKHLS